MAALVRRDEPSGARVADLVVDEFTVRVPGVADAVAFRHADVRYFLGEALVQALPPPPLRRRDAGVLRAPGALRR